MLVKELKYTSKQFFAFSTLTILILFLTSKFFTSKLEWEITANTIIYTFQGIMLALAPILGLTLFSEDNSQNATNYLFSSGRSRKNILFTKIVARLLVILLALSLIETFRISLALSSESFLPFNYSLAAIALFLGAVPLSYFRSTIGKIIVYVSIITLLFHSTHYIVNFAMSMRYPTFSAYRKFTMGSLFENTVISILSLLVLLGTSYYIFLKSYIKGNEITGRFEKTFFKNALKYLPAGLLLIFILIYFGHAPYVEPYIEYFLLKDGSFATAGYFTKPIVNGKILELDGETLNCVAEDNLYIVQRHADYSKTIYSYDYEEKKTTKLFTFSERLISYDLRLFNNHIIFLKDGKKRGSIDLVKIDLKNSKTSVTNYDLKVRKYFTAHILRATKLTSKETEIIISVTGKNTYKHDIYQLRHNESTYLDSSNRFPVIRNNYMASYFKDSLRIRDLSKESENTRTIEGKYSPQILYSSILLSTNADNNTIYCLKDYRDIYEIDLEKSTAKKIESNNKDRAPGHLYPLTNNLYLLVSNLLNSSSVSFSLLEKGTLTPLNLEHEQQFINRSTIQPNGLVIQNNGEFRGILWEDLLKKKK